MDRLKELAKYRAAGYDLIPLHMPDHVDQHGRKRGKSPRDNDWRRRRYSTSEIDDWAQRGGNVGVRLTKRDVVVDVDPRNFTPGEDVLARLMKDLALDLNVFPMAVTGSGGYHYYMRKSADKPIRNSLSDYPGIEFKTSGQQVVAVGSRHPDGGDYRWDDFSPGLKGVEAPERLITIISRPQGGGGARAGQYSPEQLVQMLDCLDPVDYGKGQHDRWVELMMACHHATDGAARQEWIEWCTRDPEYAEAGWSVGQRWDSLTNDPAKGVGVSYRTLHKHLVEAGHGDAVPQGDAQDDFQDVEPPTQEEMDERTSNEEKGPLDRMNDTYWAVDDAGKFKIMYQKVDPTFDPPRRYWVRAGKWDFADMLMNKRVQVGEGTQPISEAWLKWAGRRTAEGVVFDPEREHKGFLNLWTGWSVEPRKGDWSYLREVVSDIAAAGDADVDAYIMDWMASMVQRPGRPGEVALCLQGEKGTGKGTLGRALAKLAGRHGLHITSPEHLTGRFNVHLRDVICLFADEAVTPYDQAANSRLKGIITEPTLTFEGKGANAESGKNLIHVIMASNDDWFLPMSWADERRYLVQRVSSSRRGDSTFFGKVHDQIENGGLGAMLWDLLHRDITSFRPQSNLPKTKAAADQKVRSMGPIAAWWFNCLMDGTVPGPNLDGTPSTADWCNGPIRLPKVDVRDHFELWCRKSGIRAGGSGRSLDMTFVDELKKLTGGRASNMAKLKPSADRHDLVKQSDGRVWAYELPALTECRAFLEKGLGVDPGWHPLDGLTGEEPPELDHPDAF